MTVAKAERLLAASNFDFIDMSTRYLPGSFVRFNVTAHNEIVKETFRPQGFHATIRVRAGGCANLDSRDVIILIPPVAPTPG